MKYKVIIYLLLLVQPIYSQLTWKGQLRTRTEYRDGFGTLRLKSYDPAMFVSQRTRITSKYQSKHLQAQFTIQDVRVWGQDASTISSSG